MVVHGLTGDPLHLDSEIRLANLTLLVSKETKWPVATRATTADLRLESTRTHSRAYTSHKHA